MTSPEPGAFPVDGHRRFDVRCSSAQTWLAAILAEITWFSPKLLSSFSQVGRPDGVGGMIQEGTDSQGRRSRWTFTDVTPTSFHWQGFSAAPDGEFELFQEMRAARR
ncbi:hypothetical protein H074_10810 [Amycolatopsis decaplanina DSM 44594]|uniref:DUF1579 domain-containing protein n=1 Tax=Amycolatopsis decaplanina DSM 44594 TaxID=1284240 RepID=M2Z340_9PSEU|nr:hypothetical protein H074_10810 [Amycolatopsis decaplanina DSM 44594]